MSNKGDSCHKFHIAWFRDANKTTTTRKSLFSYPMVQHTPIMLDVRVSATNQSIPADISKSVWCVGAIATRRRHRPNFSVTAQVSSDCCRKSTCSVFILFIFIAENGKWFHFFIQAGITFIDNLILTIRNRYQLILKFKYFTFLIISNFICGGSN